MSGNENQITIDGAPGIPLQIVFGLDWLSVFIHAQDGKVEVVSRECEVVWIAAEERHLLLRCEYETHIGVFFIAIEPVFAALIKRHDVGTKARLVEALFLYLEIGRASCRASVVCLVS